MELQTIMQTTQTTSPTDPHFFKSDQVMTMLGYSDRSSFWQAVRQSGIPYVRVNARRCIFDREQLMAWIQRRSVGAVELNAGSATQ